MLVGCGQEEPKYQDVFVNYPTFSFTNWSEAETLAEPILQPGAAESIDTRYARLPCLASTCPHMFIVFRYFADQQRANQILNMLTKNSLKYKIDLPQELALEILQADTYHYYCYEDMYDIEVIRCQFNAIYHNYYLVEFEWDNSNISKTVIFISPEEIKSAIQDIDMYMASLPH
jgi:hypothetical protein